MNNNINDIEENISYLLKEYNKLKERINKSKENNALENCLDHFVPILQDISKRLYKEYFKIIQLLIDKDNYICEKRKMINDDIISLLLITAKRDHQEVVGIFNSPDEVKYDEFLDNVKTI